MRTVSVSTCFAYSELGGQICKRGVQAVERIFAYLWNVGVIQNREFLKLRINYIINKNLVIDSYLYFKVW